MRSFDLMLRAPLALLAAAALAAGAQALPQSKGFHTDSRLGFKMKPPRDWQPDPGPGR